MKQVEILTLDEAFEKGRGKDLRPRKKRGHSALERVAAWGKLSSEEKEEYLKRRHPHDYRLSGVPPSRRGHGRPGHG